MEISHNLTIIEELKTPSRTDVREERNPSGIDLTHHPLEMKMGLGNVCISVNL
jgi:hypothetical protein